LSWLLPCELIARETDDLELVGAAKALLQHVEVRILAREAAESDGIEEQYLSTETVQWHNSSRLAI